MARAKAFTYKTICSAWKATGLLLYNPTAVLKTLLRIEASTSPKTSQLIVILDYRTLKTPRTVEDLKFLQN